MFIHFSLDRTFIVLSIDSNYKVVFLFFRNLSIPHLKKRVYLFIFRERGRGTEREGKKQSCAIETSIGCLSHTPNQGRGRQPRHVPWELNWWPFAVSDNAQPTEPYQSAGKIHFNFEINLFSKKSWLYYFTMSIIS